MSKKQNKTPADFVILPLRVPGDMQKRIRGLAEKSRLSDADITRLAIERGLGKVERMFETADTAAA
jgi:predicted DNA-binding protein